MYILDLLVNFSRVSIEITSSRVNVLVYSTLYIQREYLSRERYTCFSCLFFYPIPSLCESILVDYKTRHSHKGRQRHSDACPNIYYSSLFYLEREIDLLCLSIFSPRSLLCESILVESKTGYRQAGRQRHSNARPDVYYSGLLYLERDQ